MVFYKHYVTRRTGCKHHRNVLLVVTTSRLLLVVTTCKTCSSVDLFKYVNEDYGHTKLTIIWIADYQLFK
jgi:hypothetical protein